ncbi:MAG: sugar ABC transporter ATP-binding protein [Ilumatobacteraceae bacterium]
MTDFVPLETEPWLRVTGMSKGFLGVQALAGVDLEVRPGEVHGLIGQNGAGKSTLIKILAGAYAPDEGTIEIDGQVVRFADAQASADHGIAVLYQEPQFVPHLAVFENIHLGLRPPRLGPLVDKAAMRKRSRELLARLDMHLDVDAWTSDLSFADTQMMALARALLMGARLIVMDEPTASLGAHEVEQVYRTIERLRADGVSIVYVSHRLDEIEELCDRATVLRNGRLIGQFERDALADRDNLVKLIVGVEPSKLVRAVHHQRGAVAVEARGLWWRNRVRGVDLTLHRGEVTGLVGFVGSGRTELARLVFGAERPDRGVVLVDGRPLRRPTPRLGIRRGVALLPEDRRHQASVGTWTVRENLTLAALERFSTAGFISRRAERSRFREDRERLGIKAPSAETRFGHLSGGNQQKVVIAKWLATDAQVLLFDEPTQGVDVGAQEEIHRLIRDIAHDGRAVVMISSDLAETVRVSDRVLVMREGRIVGDLDAQSTSMEQVLALCFGGVGDTGLQATG